MMFAVKMEKPQWDLLKNAVVDNLSMVQGEIYYIMHKLSMTAYYKIKKERNELSDIWNNINISIIDDCIREIERIITTDSEKDNESYKNNVKTLSDIITIISDGVSDKYDENEITLKFNKEQISRLNNICNNYCRFICGQTFPISQWLSDIWSMHHHFNSEEYFKVRNIIDTYVLILHKLCWNESANAYDGVGYDDTSDCLYDMHQVFRHELWKISGNNRLDYIVDAYPAHKTSKKYNLISVDLV